MQQGKGSPAWRATRDLLPHLGTPNSELHSPGSLRQPNSECLTDLEDL